ncbi:RICIN domain-containing protein [Thermoactinospora rubra]|uniref:RICIN domain-containing protein n=1 Tax=Thermoactinospora rubra TaxID=1088767 RepID=UPI00197FE15A|nr:RICIN domain-containing protein [Thermoactinospora rubra]
MRHVGKVSVAAVAVLAGGLLAGAAQAAAVPGPGTYVIKNLASGLCLTAPAGGAGAQLQETACDGGSDQKWTLASSGALTNGSLCAGVIGASTSAGKAVVQEACTGAASQRWTVQAASTAYRVVNANSSLCMNTGSGLIKQNSCDNATTKQWTFTSSGSNPSPSPSASPSPSPTVTPTGTPTTPPPSGGALYVAPNGTDGAAGTVSNPTTLTSAITRVAPGGTIYMRGGTYNLSQTVTIAPGNNGTSSARKKLSAYPGETPVLNFSAQSEDPANRGLAVNGSYWHVYGLVVQRAGDNGIFVGGSNNIIERTVTRYNRDTGLQLSRIASDTPRAQWPADNLILSALSHDNADSDGEDADGFAAKLTVGSGNVFRYCVARNNIDDGWDLYTKTDTGPIGPVTIEDSLAYNNGTLSDGSQAGAGDRNGYKLGGEDIAVNHVVRRNFAYRNGKHGFTYNRNPGTMTVSGNVSIDNAERNFSFDAGTSVFTQNTSCRSGSGTNDKIVGSADGTNQFWTGSNGPRCSSYAGALSWHFASDGRLVVTFG